MGMSDEIDAVFTVSCFACGDTSSSHSITPSIESKPEFITHLRSQGWKYNQSHGWRCKPCEWNAQLPRITTSSPESKMKKKK